MKIPTTITSTTKEKTQFHSNWQQKFFVKFKFPNWIKKNSHNIWRQVNRCKYVVSHKKTHNTKQRENLTSDVAALSQLRNKYSHTHAKSKRNIWNIEIVPLKCSLACTPHICETTIKALHPIHYTLHIVRWTPIIIVITIIKVFTTKFIFSVLFCLDCHKVYIKYISHTKKAYNNNPILVRVKQNSGKFELKRSNSSLRSIHCTKGM